MLQNPDSGTIKPNGVFTNGTTKAAKCDYLNYGDEDQMEIQGFAQDRSKEVLVWVLHIISLGISRLVFHWYPDWHLKCTHRRVPLQQADKILFLDEYKGKYLSCFVKPVDILSGHNHELVVYLGNGTTKILPEVRIVKCKKLTYVWEPDRQEFLKLCGLDRNVTNNELHAFHGYDVQQQKIKRITYGLNEINVPVKSIATLLVLEALTPFYIFQVFSLAVWLCEEYYYYTFAIILMSVAGITTTIIQTRRNQKNLQSRVQCSAPMIEVSRGSSFEFIPSSQLVPGDTIVVPSNGCEMQCDAVLLQGSCIVNESMLTGESVPVIKNALPSNDKKYDIKEHSTHTLFSGTKVIQTRYYHSEKVTAVVIRTGYLTAKGELVRSILYPPPADFKFDQDSYKYIIILAVIAFIGFLYTIFSKYSRALAAGDIIIKALDLITIAIPPALPAAMTVGKLYAVSRLKKAKIFCINSRVINVSGSVDCVCFDKTGTLTEDGLDLLGVLPVRDGTLSAIGPPQPDTELFIGLVTCHSLTLIDNQLSGDPLDIKMFESTGWVLEEPTTQDISKYDLLVPTIVKSSDREIGLVQQYHFSSNLQRMSVICRTLGSTNFQVFCKGSPEMIIKLSKPETVPPNTLQQLKYYAGKGYRIIGVGTKILTETFHKIGKLHREEVEDDLTFLGLVVLENRLKPQTPKVIQVLRGAGMKIIMITGDNIETAVSTARECGIIQKNQVVLDVITTPPTKNEPATIVYEKTSPQTPTNQIADIEANRSAPCQMVVSGTAWNDIVHHFPELVRKIATKGVVFARMSGPQKQQLVEELQNVGYYVAMCGDGANDCGALKAAHVGISLSETESGVASPFTSKEPNISCVTEVVREGRAALVTSFGVFKFMVCYSLTEFASAILLYGIDCNLTTFQFLFIDVVLVLNFASWFGATKACSTLHSKPPMTSMLGLIPIASLVFFLVLTVLFQTVAYYYVQTFDWFVPFKGTSNNFFASYENYAVFSMSLFQYITMAVVFSKGKPYRNAIYTNLMFSLSLVLMTIVCVYLTLWPAEWTISVLEMVLPPDLEGRWFIIVLALVNFAACWIVEDGLVECVLRKLAGRFVKRKHRLEDCDWSKKSGIINDSFNLN